MMPRMTNSAGNIFGGEIMCIIDIAAAAHSRNYGPRFVTKCVDSVDFTVPVHVGEELLATTKTTNEGNTSVTIEVRLLKRTRDGEQLVVCTSSVVMVCVNEEGKKASWRYGQ